MTAELERFSPAASVNEKPSWSDRDLNGAMHNEEGGEQRSGAENSGMDAKRRGRGIEQEEEHKVTSENF